MLTHNDEIKSILDVREPSELLLGYFGGVFSPQKDKFQAATLVNINEIDYENYQYFHEQFTDHSARYCDYKRVQKQISSGGWQSKSIEECIYEGIYQYFSITFIGIHFQQQWFIIASLCFYGDCKNEDDIKKSIEHSLTQPDFWENQPLFKPYQPTFSPLTSGRLIRNVEYEEFGDMPRLVSRIKQQKKEKVNRAYSNYINEEFIFPFFERLRIKYSDLYIAFMQLPYGYTLIFSENKRHTIFYCMAQNPEQKWLLQYFVFDNHSHQFYKWTYFKPNLYEDTFFYGDLIIEDLKQISHWDTQEFLYSSCTMDDQNFWDQYVFADDINGYLYLTLI